MPPPDLHVFLSHAGSSRDLKIHANPRGALLLEMAGFQAMPDS